MFSEATFSYAKIWNHQIETITLIVDVSGSRKIFFSQIFGPGLTSPSGTMLGYKSSEQKHEIQLDWIESSSNPQNLPLFFGI